MMGVLGMALVAVAALVVGGGVPERVVWSPDGSRAAVLGEDGVHLCDGEGKLGPLVAPKVRAVQWMPDGKRVVVDEEVELKRWKEVEGAFPEEAARQVSRRREEAVQAALAGFAGDWGNLKGELMKKTGLEDVEVTWNLMALRDGDDGTLRKQLGDHWGAVAGMEFEADAVRVIRIDGAGATEGKVLWYMYSEGLHELRVSPDGRAVAITWTDKDGNRAILKVMATDGSGQELEVGLAALYPDWSPDGKYLVYIRPTFDVAKSKGQAQFGTLSRVAVWDEHGKMVAQGKDARPEDLAGVLFDTQMRVRVAKDGRIYFVSAEVTLPVTAADFDPKPELFCVDPGRAAVVERVVPRSKLDQMGDAVQYFEISPDGRRVSTPWQDGRVSVIDLATGEVSMVQGRAFPGSDRLKLSSVPTWRSVSELTFLRPAGEGAEVVRYSMADQRAVVISKGWPREVGEHWLWDNNAGGATTAP
ncbi:MAG: TolB family protein [Phycisphaerae bacterium]